MSNIVLSKYLLSKSEVIILWLNNYEFGESLIDVTNWTKFAIMDEFAQRLVMCNEKEPDEYFRFRLLLNESEENAIRDYLSKNRFFALKYICTRKSFEPYTHLYQLYLQYLSYELNEIEKSILLDGYLHMLADLQANNIGQKRIMLERKLNLK